MAWGRSGFGPGLGGYGEVLARYWPWLIAAAIAERANLWPPRRVDSANGSEPASPARAIVMPPGAALVVKLYFNVVRMHLLILFFAGASKASASTSSSPPPR